MNEYGLGLDYGEVVLVQWDPRWPAAYEAVAATVRMALPHAAVEHVGSTAVPGLVAKPILDIAVGAAPDMPVDALAAYGFDYRGDHGDEGGRLLVLNARPSHRTAHLHVVNYGDDRWRLYLAFRDRLRSDDTTRAAYADLKRALAVQFPHDRGGYTAAKADFIRAVIT